MKVLFVSSGGEIGEVSPIVRNQGISLIKQGCSLTFFIIHGRGLVSYLNHIFKLRKVLRNNKFDIIHAHYGLCGIVAFLAHKNEKLVVSYMGDDIVGSNKKNGSITYQSKVISNINRAFSRYFYDQTIVKSSEMMHKIMLKNNISVIPNGVNLEVFTEVERHIAMRFCNFNHDEINLIFLSNPNRPEKNFDLASSACKRQGENVKLHIIYDVKTEILKNYYCAADALILSSFHEGSPNVIKEAMACNCPCVSTDVGDVKWLFGETQGYFISQFDANDFADKIRLAIEYRTKYGGTSGRKRILELGLNEESIAKRIMEVYDESLNLN